MLCWFLPYNNNMTSHKYTSVLSLLNLLALPRQSLCHHRVLDWAFCVMAAASYHLFYMCANSYVSVLFSQLAPLLSFALCVHSLFSMSESLFLTATYPYTMVQDCLCTTMAELSSCYKGPVTLNLRIFAVWPITENLCQFWSISSPAQGEILFEKSL